MIRTLPPENIYGHTKKLEFILNCIAEFKRQHSAPITILDFGCGNGSAVSQYLIQDDTIFYGVDFHAPSIEYAKARFSRPNAQFEQSLPQNIKFDIIVYADVLEHLPDPLSTLAEHRSVIDNKGMIVGSVPNGYGPFENEKRLDKFLRLSSFMDFGIKRIKVVLNKTIPEVKDLLPYNESCGHVKYYTKNKLIETLKESGFKLVRLQNGVWIGAPLSDRFINMLNSKNAIYLWNARIADQLPH